MSLEPLTANRRMKSGKARLLYATAVRLGPSTCVGLIFLAMALLVIVVLPLLPGYDPYGQGLARGLAPPFATVRDTFYVVGTDQLGRDVLDRIALAARVSVIVAAVAVLVSLLIGVVLGIVAGFLRGWVENVVVGLADLQLSIPRVLLLIAVAAVVGPSARNLALMLGLTSWVAYARVARAMALSLREREFVLAARTYGAASWWNMWHHILPNVRSQMIIIASFEFGEVMILASLMNYLGLGVQPPTPSLGLMIKEAQVFLSTAPWLVIGPGAVLFMLIAGAQFSTQRLTTERANDLTREASGG